MQDCIRIAKIHKENKMKLIRKCLLVCLGLFAMSAANAYQDNCEPQPVCPPEPPCCDIPGGPTTSAYNHPAGIDVCGSWDFYVTGTFLWWEPIQEQMEFAETTFASPSTSTGSVHKLSFDWKAAFKVGIGYAWGYDNWDSYLQYTRVNTTMSSSATLGTGVGESLNDAWLTQSPGLATINRVTEKWSLDHNMFDLECGRPYYNGKHLTFKAHYGLRGGWIDQTTYVTAFDEANDATATGTYKSDSWLIGPRAGIYTKWQLDEGFRFFGNAAASLFYQKFSKISVREPYINNTAQWYFSEDHSIGYVNTSVDMLLGLGWGTYFDRNNWHFDLAIGYEAQVYFNQNMMRYLQQMSLWTTANVLTKPGNLMFHGLNVTARLDF